MKSVSSHPVLTTPFIEVEERPKLVRRRTTTDCLFTELTHSPLHDLAPVATLGLTTRVTHSNSVAISLDQLGLAFEPQRDSTLILVQGGYTAALVKAAGTAVLCALMYGFHLGNMNPAAPAMRADLGIEAGVENDNAWAFCVSIFCLGALLGCSLVPMVADSIGRRKTILLISTVYLLGSALEAASGVVPRPASPLERSSIGLCLLLAGRAVCGVASGSSTVVVPMYLGEISPPHLRGALGTCFQLTCCTGILLAQIVGLPALLGRSGLWPVYLALGALPAASLLVLHSFLLESPRWLAGRSDAEAIRAQAILAALRGEPLSSLAVVQELDLMQMAAGPIAGGGGDGGGLRSLLSDSVARRGLFICVTCHVCQQFSGINNVFNYSTIFLTSNGVDAATVVIISVLMNVGNVAITVVSVRLMDLSGRRSLMLVSCVGMALSTVALTTSLSCPGHGWTAPLAIASVVGFVMSFGVGLGPVPWLLPAELFAPDRCALGASVSAGSNWMANFVVGQAFMPLSNALKSACFLPFAVVVCGFAVFVTRTVPETKGKSLDQILFELSAHTPQGRPTVLRKPGGRF